MNIRKILWVYLMNCLDIHHQVKGRKFKTIQDAQEQAVDQIYKNTHRGNSPLKFWQQK